MTIKPVLKAPKHEAKGNNDVSGDINGPNGGGGGGGNVGGGGGSGSGGNIINNLGVVGNSGLGGGNGNNGGIGGGSGHGSVSGGGGGVVLGVGVERGMRSSINAAGKIDVGGGMSPRGDHSAGGGGGSLHHRRRRHTSPHKRHYKRSAGVGSNASAMGDNSKSGNKSGAAVNYQLVLDHHNVPASAMSPRHGGVAGGSNLAGGSGGLLMPSVAMPSNSGGGGVGSGGVGISSDDANSIDDCVGANANAAHCSSGSSGGSGGGPSGGSIVGNNNHSNSSGGDSVDDGNTYSGYNSGDEHIGPKDGAGATLAEWQDRDQRFVKTMLDARGFDVTEIAEDGACLFRSISLQLYGDQDMHEVIRQQTMDYIYKNREYFAQFVTEDIGSYVLRKRNNHVHGNHIEIQAISEIYNRPVELYCYRTEPINIFNSDQLKNGYEPLRLSYQRGSHYNAILNPYKASVGVGLGLAGYSPTRPDRVQLHDAVRMSEDLEIEQTMFEDKLKTTDWEATNVAIEEQIARESYLQWCRDNMQSQRERLTAAAATSAVPTVASIAAAGLDVGSKTAKGSDDDSLEDGSSFGSDSELKLEQSSAPTYGSPHYGQHQRTVGSERRRKRRRCATAVPRPACTPPPAANVPAAVHMDMAGPSTRSGSVTPPKQVRLEAIAAIGNTFTTSNATTNTTPTDDLPGTSRQAVASTSSSSSSSSSCSATPVAAPVSSFYHELLESSYSDDFADATGRQLSEEQMLQKALQMSRLDFVHQQLGGRPTADSDPPSP